MNKELTHKEFCKKLIDSFMKLINRGDLDKIIYGNTYWEFTDRKIEVIEPDKVKWDKKGLVIQSNRLTKDELYGKSILEPKNEQGDLK